MTVRFTDGVSGATRLDLDVDETTVYVTSDDFDLGVATLLGEPGAEGADYSYRDITFKVIVSGTNLAALTVLSQVAVEVQRDSNWLMVQFDSTLPQVWFRTWKTTPGALDLQQASKDGVPIPGMWTITVRLTADALGIGAKQTLGSVTIYNDPASTAGANRCRYVLPALKGDSLAPLTVQVQPSASWQDCRPLMSLVRHTGTAPGAVVWQTSAFTPGADTTNPSATDTAFSAGSKTIVAPSAATMVSRLTGTAPSTPAAGRYQVLLRMARSDQVSTFAVKLLQTYGTGLSVGNGKVGRFDRGSSPAAGFATLVDLGEFAFPIGSDGWTAADVGTPAAPVIDLQVQRLTGNGNAWLDYLVLIPVDTTTTVGATTLRSLFRDVPFPANRAGVWDGEAERYRAVDNPGSSPVMAQTPVPEPAGRYLVADPAATNVLHLHQQVDAITPTVASDNSDQLAGSATVTISYYPRYLNLAAA